MKRRLRISKTDEPVDKDHVRHGEGRKADNHPQNRRFGFVMSASHQTAATPGYVA